MVSFATRISKSRNYRAARRCIGLADRPSAIKYMQQAYNADNKDNNIRRELLELYIQEEDFCAARNLYSSIDVSSEGDLAIHLLGLECFLALSCMDDAVTLIAEILNVYGHAGDSRKQLLDVMDKCVRANILEVNELSTVSRRLARKNCQVLCGQFLIQHGDLVEAKRCLEVLVGDSEIATVDLQLMAACFLKLRDYEKSEAVYKMINERDQNNPDALLGLAISRYAFNSHLAISTCSELLALCPNHGPACLQLGIWLHEKGDYEQALKLYRRAIEIQPEQAGIHFRLGRLLLSLDQEDEAIHEFEYAFCVDNSLADARLEVVKHFDEEKIWEKLDLIEDSLDYESCKKDRRFFHEKARCFHKLKDIEKAIEVIEEVVSRFPDEVSTLNLYAVLLRESGRSDLAYRAIKCAEELSPNDVAILINVGAIAGDLGRVNEALAAYEKAIKLKPENTSIKWNRGMCLLADRKFCDGWKDYEYRWNNHLTGNRDFGFPVWPVENLHVDSLLVYSEQGLGDQIMFASCVPDISRHARKVILECNSKLETLFSRSFKDTIIVANDDPQDVSLPNFSGRIDAQIACGSLPMHFRNSLADFLGGNSYLVADSSKIDKWRQHISCFRGKRVIGLSWRGGLYETRTNMRSLPVERLGPLLKLPNTEFFSLQYGEVQDDLATIEQTFGVKIHHFQDMVDDYDETAAFLANMDVVVSVQTSLVHLCGALGVPVLCMLPKVPEWRYGYTGDSMPWYASVRLFRQQSIGDWGGILENVCAAIEQEFS